MNTRTIVGFIAGCSILLAVVGVGAATHVVQEPTLPAPITAHAEESVQAYPQGDWLDRLIAFLEFICEYLGPEYCNPEETGICDDATNAHLTAFVTEYNANGLPPLTATESAEVSDAIVEILDLLDDPECGSTTVIGDAITAFESAYDDLN